MNFLTKNYDTVILFAKLLIVLWLMYLFAFVNADGTLLAVFFVCLLKYLLFDNVKISLYVNPKSNTEK